MRAVMHLSSLLLVCTLLPCVFSDALYKNIIRRDEYDYIVVGAGSTGSVIASRLSEDQGNTVLLLEAGGPPPEETEVPLTSYRMTGTNLDWKYVTAPQKNACLAFPDQSNEMPRGKVLGGTSILNCMLYVRGNHDDFNDWERKGATGWSWEDVSYYFLKSEDQTNLTLLLDGYHKTGGLLTVSGNVYSTHIRNVILDAAASSGYDITDFNGANQQGFGVAQFTVRDGRRCSTEKAFLRPAAKRPNLDIIYNAFVTHISFEGNTARNVSFDFQNSARSIAARKDIILSAGAIGSPQILMLSGVGPKEHLDDMKIPVVADLPVGMNLQDHIREAGFQYHFKDPVGLVLSRDVTKESYEEYKQGKGPLTVPCGVELQGFLKTKYQNGSDQRPDILLTFLSPVWYPGSSGEQEDIITVSPTLLRPASRGFIKLNSSNPYDHPVIDPQYLTEEIDLLRIVEGWKMTKALLESQAIQAYKPVWKRKRPEGCDMPDMNSDEYIKCITRALTHTADHQAGTCKMGDPSDPTTVLDPQLRVKGINNLRVADASVMPSVTTGNTNAVCIMIGEKASDLILGRKWDSQQEKVVKL